MLAFDKSDGTYIEQYIVTAGQPSYSAVTGMIVVSRPQGQPPVLVWTSGEDLDASPLEAIPAPGATPTPGSSPSPTPSPTRRGATPKPTP